MTEPEKMHFMQVEVEKDYKCDCQGNSDEQAKHRERIVKNPVRGLTWKDENRWSNRQVLVVVIAFAAGWLSGLVSYMAGWQMAKADSLKLDALERVSTITIPAGEIDRGAIVVGRANEPRVLKEQKRKKK